MSIVQAGVLGVMGALLAVQFKNGKTEYGIYISVAISVFIFLSIVGQLEEIIDTIRQISGHINMDTSYVGTLIKMLGVTYIAEFASGICRDTGYQTIASQIRDFWKTDHSGHESSGFTRLTSDDTGIFVMRGKGIRLCIFIVILGCFFFPRMVDATEIRNKDEQAELQKEAEETLWEEFEF